MKNKDASKNNSFKENKAVQLFSSFEEENEATAIVKASLSPQKHIENVTERITKMYADELKKPMDKNLKFKHD